MSDDQKTVNVGRGVDLNLQFSLRDFHPFIGDILPRRIHRSKCTRTRVQAPIHMQLQCWMTMGKFIWMLPLP